MADSMMTFELQGLDDLIDDIQAVYREYPDETDKEMRKAATDFKKDVNDKMPADYANGKTPIPKKWKIEREKSLCGGGYTVAFDITNTARHWHLVENGHEEWIPISTVPYIMNKRQSHNESTRKKPSHKTKANVVHKGFIPGKFYCRDTRAEWASGEFEKRVREHLEKILARHNL